MYKNMEKCWKYKAITTEIAEHWVVNEDTLTAEKFVTKYTHTYWYKGSIIRNFSVIFNKYKIVSR